jgi:hypothetical protein
MATAAARVITLAVTVPSGRPITSPARQSGNPWARMHSAAFMNSFSRPALATSGADAGMRCPQVFCAD